MCSRLIKYTQQSEKELFGKDDIFSLLELTWNDHTLSGHKRIVIRCTLQICFQSSWFTLQLWS